ncbi:hypothetical protein Pcinc_024119 [Petrolisthes cinctipes]|uniref:Uncharacterized protein n=1 Tax=Petrolisthes cinctipes TaxID=88211 RepID=A0AAE1FAJ2_PETCI|nr:hypothetical protein Pcinc_024119 [Petrolisthes cinctipes]
MVEAALDDDDGGHRVNISSHHYSTLDLHSTIEDQLQRTGPGSARAGEGKGGKGVPRMVGDGGKKWGEREKWGESKHKGGRKGSG